jgi:hypothetical protein
MPGSTSTQGLPYPLGGEAAEGHLNIKALADSLEIKLNTLATELAAINALFPTKAPTTHSHSVLSQTPEIGWGVVGASSLGNIEATDDTYSAWSTSTVTVTAGRRYLFLYKSEVSNGSTEWTGGTGAQIEIGLTVTSGSPTTRGSVKMWVEGSASAFDTSVSTQAIVDITSSGSRTIGHRVKRTSVNGRPVVTGGSFILIDIGPS